MKDWIEAPGPTLRRVLRRAWAPRSAAAATRTVDGFVREQREALRAGAHATRGTVPARERRAWAEALREDPTLGPLIAAAGAALDEELARGGRMGGGRARRYARAVGYEERKGGLNSSIH
jgi:hypothetical protein